MAGVIPLGEMAARTAEIGTAAELALGTDGD
jgi:hypothetical protein